jgi:hypothetical protein
MSGQKSGPFICLSELRPLSVQRHPPRLDHRDDDFIDFLGETPPHPLPVLWGGKTSSRVSWYLVECLNKFIRE